MDNITTVDIGYRIARWNKQCGLPGIRHFSYKIFAGCISIYGIKKSAQFLENKFGNHTDFYYRNNNDIGYMNNFGKII